MIGREPCRVISMPKCSVIQLEGYATLMTPCGFDSRRSTCVFSEKTDIDARRIPIVKSMPLKFSRPVLSGKHIAHLPAFCVCAGQRGIGISH